MKHVVYFILVSLLAFTSCKKDGSSPTQTNPTIIPTETLPSAPTLIAPSNSGTGITIPCTITWSASSGATSYTLQIALDFWFNDMIYEKVGVQALNQPIDGLNNLTKYYWRVSATNSHGTSPYSPVWNFSTASPTTTASISGKVINSSDQVISGAKIYTTPATSTVYSDSLGNYSINDIAGGTYSVYAEKAGYDNYKVSVYVIQGQAYGHNITMITTGSVTSCVGIPTVTYEGKTYNTVQIGNQCWLKENLDVGVMIQGTANQSNNQTIEKYCYDDNLANCSSYGGLYQWSEAVGYSDVEAAQGICPAGWHLPTKEDFRALITTVNNNSKALRAVGQGAGTNTSGFSALFAGYRFNYGYFYNLDDHATFWSSTEYSDTDVFYLGLRLGDSYVDLGASGKTTGFSVRCVKD